VTELLAAGADPNGAANASTRVWISSAGSNPKPLNCVAIAWTMTENHVAIARLLIQHGAIVDDSVLTDHNLEMTGSAADIALQNVLAAAPRNG
jgi:hypothetical protein